MKQIRTRTKTKTKTRIYSLIAALLLTLTLFPGSVFALEEGEQGHNHTQGYCYVCKTDDYSQALSYNVPQDFEEESAAVMIGEEAYWSLAEAVQAAAPGDTLHIQRSMELMYPVMIDKDLTLVGDFADIVIYRGFSEEAMLTVRNGAFVRVEYLTFDGGSDVGYFGYSIVNVLDGSSLVLSNGTTLQHNWADYGGGAYVDAFSTLQISGEMDTSQITQCYADYSGGAIYSEGTVQILLGAYISGNIAEYGGGIWISDRNSLSLADPEAVYANTDSYGEESNIRDAQAQPASEEPYVHTVYIIPGDDSEPVTVPVNDGDMLEPPEDISWDGHIFTGWTYIPYDDGEFYPYDFSQPVYSDLTVYANWEQVPDPASQEEWQQQSELDRDWDPQYSQQSIQQSEFDQIWSQQSIQQSELDQIWTQQGFRQVMDQQPVEYQLSFDYNVEGWNITTRSVTAGGYATDPYDPAAMPREGYTLTGWYYYTNEGEFEFDFDQPVDQNYYLTAKWAEVQPAYVTVTAEPSDGSIPALTMQSETDIVIAADQEAVVQQYILRFDANGGSGTPIEDITADPGQTVTLPANTFTNPDHYFVAWSLYESGEGDEYPAGYPYVLGQEPGTVTFYAKWSLTPPQMGTVSFDGNGADSGTVDNITQEIGSIVTIPGNGFVRAGWEFTGWNTLADGTGTAYAPGAIYALEGTTNDLYAQWEIQTFAVTFDPCNGSTSILQMVPYGQKAAKPEVQVPAGYRLEGWYREAAYVSRFDLDNTPITDNITLFAKWEQIPVEIFTVSFYTDKGTAPAPQSVQLGQMAYKPADPYAEGYLFGGWYLDQAFTSLYNFNSPVTGNLSLYAKWAPRPDLDHVVSFNANGHGNAPDPQTVKGGELAVRPEAPKAVGYTFTGWFTDPQCTRAFNFQEPVTEDTILYAGWTVNRYTIRFDSNTGAGTMASIGVSYDQRANLPANTFTKSGFYFLGWNTLADGTGVFIADRGEVLNLTDVNGGTVDLYAQWKNIYNIIEGANAQVMKESGKGLTFRCDGDYSKFTGIKVDGRNVPSSQYTSSLGSTVVTLHADFVSQLNVGTHTLRFEYTDGGVETCFEVLSRTPTTGDTNNTLIWIIIAIVALLIIGIVTAVLLIRRRRADRDDPYFDDFGPGGDHFSRDYDDRNDSWDEDTYHDGYEDEYEYDESYDDGGDDYDSGRGRSRARYDQDDHYETDEDRYERYVDDQLKHRGKRK